MENRGNGGEGPPDKLENKKDMPEIHEVVQEAKVQPQKSNHWFWNILGGNKKEKKVPTPAPTPTKSAVSFNKSNVLIPTKSTFLGPTKSKFFRHVKIQLDPKELIPYKPDLDLKDELTLTDVDLGYDADDEYSDIEDVEQYIIDSEKEAISAKPLQLALDKENSARTRRGVFGRGEFIAEKGFDVNDQLDAVNFKVEDEPGPFIEDFIYVQERDPKVETFNVYQVEKTVKETLKKHPFLRPDFKQVLYNSVQCRSWACPTSLRTWFGEEGYIWLCQDFEYWTEKYFNCCPDPARFSRFIKSHKDLEDYLKMRAIKKAPPFYSWTSKWMEERDESLYSVVKHLRYAFPDEFDAEVQVKSGELFHYDPRVDGGHEFPICLNFFNLNWTAFKEYWNRRVGSMGLRNPTKYDDLVIRHYNEAGRRGGLWRNLDDLEHVYYYFRKKFGFHERIEEEPKYPKAWRVWRMIEDSPNIDKEEDYVKGMLSSFEPYGDLTSRSRYTGFQWIIMKRGLLGANYEDEFPGNYCMEFERGAPNFSDTWSRTREPLYDRMVELSKVYPATVVKMAKRRGRLQDFWIFWNQFQFQALPFIRRVKVALDVLSKPFSYKDDVCGRLEGNLWLLSRTSRIIPWEDFACEKRKNANAWKEFKNFIDFEGKALEVSMEYLLKTLKPVLEMFRRMYIRMYYAKQKVEWSSMWHWHLQTGRNFYLGIGRFGLLNGAGFYKGKWVDKPFGVARFYDYNYRHYHVGRFQNFNLEQFPKSGWTHHPRERETGTDLSFAGAEIPPKPALAPFDLDESSERIPFTFHWQGDDRKCHIEFVKAARCVNFNQFDFEGKKIIFHNLFRNAIDVVSVARDQFFQAMYYLSKNKDEHDLTFMTPTGPKGPQDSGYQALLFGLGNPNIVHPLDPVALVPIEELMATFYTNVDKMRSSWHRVMEGTTGGSLMLATMEQIHDFHGELHMMRPFLFNVKRKIEANIRLVRGLAKCRNFVEVSAFIASNLSIRSPIESKLLRSIQNPFCIVRFSLDEADTIRLCSKISRRSPDTLEDCVDFIQSFSWIDDGYRRTFKKRKLDSWCRKWRLYYTHYLEYAALGTKMFPKLGPKYFLDESSDKKRRWDVDLLYSPHTELMGVRRGISRDKVYLKNDREAKFGGMSVSIGFRKQDKCRKLLKGYFLDDRMTQIVAKVKEIGNAAQEALVEDALKAYEKDLLEMEKQNEEKKALLLNKEEFVRRCKEKYEREKAEDLERIANYRQEAKEKAILEKKKMQNQEEIVTRENVEEGFVFTADKSTQTDPIKFRFKDCFKRRKWKEWYVNFTEALVSRRRYIWYTYHTHREAHVCNPMTTPFHI